MNGISVAACATVLALAAEPARTDSTSYRIWHLNSALSGALRPDSQPKTKHPALIGDLREVATNRLASLLTHRPGPIETLRSAGVAQKDDPDLQATVRAVRDADVTALLAVAWTLTDDNRYLVAARAHLLAWAKVNVPTGHPIDETRLEGFLWGYDLLRSHIEEPDAMVIEAWFARILAAKSRWKFGPESSVNNHMTHHLKMMLLLHRVLGQTDQITMDLQKVRDHLRENLSASDGSSVDFRSRDALFYHVYDLEAWVEIALQTGCCKQEIDRAVQFLILKLGAPTPHGEFVASTSDFDRARARGGFDYARPGRPYDPRRARRLGLAYSTLRPDRTVQLVDAGMGSSDLSEHELFYWLRKQLWASEP
ncbi:MAG: alginate lyase family protein [Acidobacteria bacterium]|nr:alginate lyase family protein [Acidobacteriota bacterium]